MTPRQVNAPKKIVAKQAAWGAACKEKEGERGCTGAGAVNGEGEVGNGCVCLVSVIVWVGN